jgi:hypothetical protein
MGSENLMWQVNRNVDKISAEEFYEMLNKLMKSVMLLRQDLPSTVSSGTGEKVACGFKKKKDHITMLVFVNATGTHEVKLTVFGKSANTRSLKGIIQLHVECKPQSDSWMVAGIFTWWFHRVFAPVVREQM